MINDATDEVLNKKDKEAFIISYIQKSGGSKYNASACYGKIDDVKYCMLYALSDFASVCFKEGLSVNEVKLMFNYMTEKSIITAMDDPSDIERGVKYD